MTAVGGLDERLAAELARLEKAGLRRRLRPSAPLPGARIRIEGREYINFASNDYLGLAMDPALRERWMKELAGWGGGAGASRLLGGSLEPLHQLEETLARFKQTEAALVFSSGFAAAIGTIPAIVGPGDVVVLDRLAHASLVDGARLSRAKLRVFRHNDPEDLERILRWAQEQHPDGRVLVVTESVFSMDGDGAPLAELVALKQRYGAWLLVDEAHATGLYGPRQAGRVAEAGLSGQVELQMATLGKALGSAGGAICGSKTLVEFLVNRARSLIYSTGPTPAQTVAALVALRWLETEEGAARVRRLWANVDGMRDRLATLGWPLPAHRSPIIPLVVGQTYRAIEMAAHLAERGLWLPAVRPPTVPRGTARLRLSVSAAHSERDLDLLADALARLGPPPAA